MGKRSFLALLALGLVSLILMVPTAASALTCTISGTNGDDNLPGTPGDDKICGYAGDDTVFGHAGDDTVTAGRGNDRVNGGQGEDTLKGGPGNDVLQADQDGDVDHLYGNAGFDRCVAGPEDYVDDSCEEVVIQVT